MSSPVRLPAHIRLDDPNVDRRHGPGRDLLRNRKVFVKLSRSRKELRLLRSEWQTLHQLSPRFVSDPVEYHEWNDKEAYLVTHWIPGIPIDNFWRTATSQQKLTVVLRALAGLDHLHKSGIAHCDLRPQNLLVAVQGSAVEIRWIDLEHAQKIGSFGSGFSYVVGWHPEPGITDRQLLSQSDIAAFGAVLGFLCPEDVATEGPEWVIGEFARRLRKAFYLNEMPHARAAWFVLSKLLEKAGIEAAPGDQPLNNAGLIQRRNANRGWESRLTQWLGSNGSTILQVRGARGSGKTTFLKTAVAPRAGADFAVLNLLQISDALDQERVGFVSAWLSITQSSDMKGHIILVSAANLPILLNQVRAEAGRKLLWVVEGNPSAPVDTDLNSDIPLDNMEWHMPTWPATEWQRWILASV